MNISQQTVILSAELTSNREERNRQLTENLKNCLIDCNFKFSQAERYYKSEPETSFVVLVNNDSEIELLKDFAFKNFKQESVLYVDSNQQAYVMFPSEEKRLGKFIQVSEHEAKKQDNYTVLHGKYYLAKGA